MSTLPLKAMSRLWGRFNELVIPYYLRVPGFKLYSWVFGVKYVCPYRLSKPPPFFQTKLTLPASPKSPNPTSTHIPTSRPSFREPSALVYDP